MLKKIFAALMVCSGALVLSAAPFSLSLAQAGEAAFAEPVIVTVDRSKVIRISRPAATVIIGNPSIVDATVQDEVTLVLTGKSFGVTNMIILDHDGNPVVDETIVVKGHSGNTVRIYRRTDRETLACAPTCERTLSIGDNEDYFKEAEAQIKKRNELSQGAAASN